MCSFNLSKTKINSTPPLFFKDSKKSDLEKAFELIWVQSEASTHAGFVYQKKQK